ncbi:uncharacterized protein LOC131157219 isoform X2 [Malania oleifera]|uniref:uncharacterized protein LOC131157219 isoform X2 n=1 Tax=Malania oleifera TaxID=397392 RepID=UPI0025AE24F2|nr:uncharacterized protein LOC131157219 isoform X2 [Malania oleifera]
MSWGGEWMCCRCQHLNFKKREACHKCGRQKFGGESTDESSYGRPAEEVLPGDWYCSAAGCGAHNFASRTSCRRCSAPKDDCYYGEMMGSGGSYGCDGSGGRPGWKTGDWICTRPGCGEHNYASRIQCFRCQTPKDCSGAM